MKKLSLRLLIGVLFGFLLYSTAYSSYNMPGDEDYLAFADEMPAPVGGIGGIISKIVYPNIAKQAKIEGKVFLIVYVNEKGGVDDVKVLKGIGAGCDDAAMDVVKKSKFNPGKNKGVPVKVKMSMAITFKL